MDQSIEPYDTGWDCLRARWRERLGIKLSAYQYRERVKSMYYPLEFAVLHDLSQLPPDEFINILYDIA
jgi:hypothetical protein